ncbi:MAG: leucine-rich repeat domain-containing protein [Saprospiraceae bacterium]
MRAYSMAATKGQEPFIQMLYLNRQALKAVPPAIQQMTQLKTLDLSDNELGGLPIWLKDLEKLEELYLSGNVGLAAMADMPLPQGLLRLHLKGLGWTLLPDSLMALKKLTYIDISHNRLKRLPPGFEHLKSLKTILIDHNALSRLPETMGAFRQLNELHLRHNHLKKLPHSIANCIHLDKLILAHNQLTQLPATFGQLGRLSELDLSENRIRQLPASIGHCDMLRRLYLSGNRLSQLPLSMARLQWLTDLDLSKNKFRQFPSALQDCKRLERLYLQANQIEHLPDLSPCIKLATLHLAKNGLQTLNGLPASLKVLHLDHNQLIDIHAIQGLPALEQLSFSANAIAHFHKGYWQFPQLKSIQAKGNPVKLTSSDLLGCPALTVLDGLLPLSEKRKLLAFLPIVRRNGWDTAHAAAFFPLFRGDTTAWQTVSIARAWEGLNNVDPYFADAFRQHFHRLTKSRRPLKKGATLLVLGNLSSATSVLGERLADQQITYQQQWDASVTHLVLGLPPFPASPPPTTIPWLSEAQLIRHLDKLEGRSLSQTKATDQIQNLRNLLLNKAEVNCHLALQLMDGGGVPLPIVADLLFLYLTRPFPNLADKLKALLWPYLPPITKLMLAAQYNPPQTLERKKDWQEWLGTKEIDVDRLLFLFKRS